MSNPTQAVLSIVGGLVGWVVSAGNPLGFAWGMSLGASLGSLVSPTDLGTVSGPRLNDLNVQVSTVGAPIPIVYGTYAISGNVIWSSGIIETVSKKKQGGKGGPTQTVKTYTYKVNCAVGLCEGEIGGIQRIWADAKLIYDARPQQDGEDDTTYADRLLANAALLAATEIYTGTETQLADPTIESFEGVGNVSGFRGLAYVVFAEFQLADYGNRIPNFRFEVVRQLSLECSTTIELSNEVLHPWIEGDDPRNPLNEHGYHWNSLSLEGPFQTFDEAMDGLRTYYGKDYQSDTLYCWKRTDGAPETYAVAPDNPAIVSGDAMQLLLGFNVLSDAPRQGDFATIGINCGYPDLFKTAHWWNRKYNGAYVPSLQTGIVKVFTKGGDDGIDDVPDAYAENCFGGTSLARWFDRFIFVQRIPSAPEGDDWQLVTGTAKVLSNYSRGLTDNASPAQYPLNPCLLPSDENYSSQAYWEAAYAEAVAAGDMPAGLTYGFNYPDTVTEYWRREVVDCTVPEGGAIRLMTIVADVCNRCGLTDSQIDVGDLTEIVDGYVITRVMSGRDAISPLRSYGFFDCVESDGVLKWPTRGKATVATVTDEDLCAFDPSGNRPSSMEVARTQTIELPRRLRVHYAQAEQNYEPGEQSASRLSAGAQEVRDLEVAVSMSDRKAAQIADVVLYDLWTSRNSYRLILDHSFLGIEPADAFEAPVDGRVERLRAVSTDYSMPGLIAIEAVRDDDGVYVSYATSAPTATTGGGGSISTPGESDLVLLDLPLLRDTDNDAGYYAALRAIGGMTFGGAVIYRSPDGGTTYDDVAVVDAQATIGELTAALPAGPTTIVDEGNELLVELTDGELESIADASLLAGLNAAAIGTHGRWEIIQFKTASGPDSSGVWTLTGLVRGRRGTEWAVGTSEVGDRFVLLDAAVVRIPSNIAAIGAEREHKGVLAGTSIDTTTAIDFTCNAVALEPFSVVGIEGTWEDDGDLAITWIRRGRIGQELPSGVDIPISEASEAYEVDILSNDSPETVLRTLSSSSPAVTYTAAQQAEDFGSPLPESVTVRIYQLSAVVGRGYPAEATL